MKDFKNPVGFYIGKSKSHQIFRSQLVKEKILHYQLNKNRELLSQFYKSEIEDKLARHGDIHLYVHVSQAGLELLA